MAASSAFTPRLDTTFWVWRKNCAARLADAAQSSQSATELVDELAPTAAAGGGGTGSGLDIAPCNATMRHCRCRRCRRRTGTQRSR